MKICHLLTYHPDTVGGIETVSLELGKGYDIRWIGASGFFSILKGFFTALSLRFSKYDIIHIHDNAGYWCTWLSRNKKLIYTDHGFWKSYFDANRPKNIFEKIGEKILVRMQTRIIKKSDVVVPITSEIMSKLKHEYNLSPHYVIHNGVDTKKFRPLKNKKEFDYIWVGTNSISKRLVEAKNLANRNGKSLLIVGVDGENSKNIKYMKSVGRSKMPSIFNRARTFIYFNKQNAYSLALLEAMACGLNVITNEYILRELTSQGKFLGYVVLDGKRKRFVRMNGKNSMNLARSTYDWEIIRREYRKLYHSLLENDMGMLNANTKK